MTRKLLAVSVFLFVLLFPSCTPGPAFVSSHGVAYYGPVSWSTSQINQQEEGFLAAFQQLKGIDPYRSIKRATVIITTEDIDCNGIKTNGCQDGKFLLVKDLGSPYSSALTHEMAHWLQQDLLGVNDYKHEDTALWSIADRTWTSLDANSLKGRLCW